MRVSTHKLGQLAIFTTLMTGTGLGTLYYLQHKAFVRSDYHRFAIEKLKSCSVAMEMLGAPPLKIYNIRLTDSYNRVDTQTAQLKIPVTGSKTGAYLYTTSTRDADTKTWSLNQAVLKLKDGQVVDLLNPLPPSEDALDW